MTNTNDTDDADRSGVEQSIPKLTDSVIVNLGEESSAYITVDLTINDKSRHKRIYQHRNLIRLLDAYANNPDQMMELLDFLQSVRDE